MTTASAVEVVIGAGSIGQAIARRVGAGTTILLADLNPDTAGAAAHSLRTAGFTVETAHVDVADRATIDALAGKWARLRGRAVLVRRSRHAGRL